MVSPRGLRSAGVQAKKDIQAASFEEDDQQLTRHLLVAYPTVSCQKN